MSSLNSVVTFLDDLLASSQFKDVSLNGLQVQSDSTELNTIACAVDAGLSVIEKAVQAKAQLLIVHHGLFWGEVRPITGVLAKKIKLLFEAGCSLYASHLPLDANSEVGNSFELARYLKLTELQPFFPYNGQNIGVRGVCNLKLEDVVTRCREMQGAVEPLVLPFGNESIRTVGIVTGSGASAIGHSAAEGLDLLVTGEPRHEAYHLAKELQINVVFAGHYATETFGVRALERKLSQHFKLKTIFLHEGSGI